MEIKKLIEEKYNQSLSYLEDLNLQVHLGKEEAKQAFEQQKKEIGTWAQMMSDKIAASKEFTEEEIQNARVELEELRLQVALGKAETKEAIEEQRKAITQKLNRVHGQLEHLYQLQF